MESDTSAVDERLRAAQRASAADAEGCQGEFGEVPPFLRAILNTLSSHIAVLNAAGCIIAVNEPWRSFARANGADPDAVGVGADYVQVCREATGLSSDGAAEVAAGLQAMLEGEREHFEIEYPCHAPDEERWFVMRAALFYDEGAPHVVVVHENVTERKAAEEVIRASDARYRTLFESIDEGFCVLQMLFDDEGEPIDYRFLETNPAFERHTGLVNAMGKTAYELVPGLERHWVEAYARVARTGQRERFVQGSDVMGRWFEVEAFRTGDPAEQKVALLFADVTERKRSEAALLEAKETLETRVAQRTAQVRKLASSLTMAEHAERARIAQILHDDLQQLLYAIRMQLSSGGTLSDKVEQALDWLGDAIRLTRRLTVDLSPPILSGEGLADALAWLAAQVQERHGLPVTVRDETRAPALRDDALRVLLFQVVRELLFNVVKHAEAQQATVTLDRDATYLRICVADDGRGMDPAALKAPEPVGFGLSTIRERLSLLGGHMTVEGDEGTRVTVYVPQGPNGVGEVAA